MIDLWDRHNVNLIGAFVCGSGWWNLNVVHLRWRVLWANSTRTEHQCEATERCPLIKSVNEGEALQETTSDLIPTCEYVNLHKKSID